jgi:hypothetical protein
VAATGIAPTSNTPLIIGKGGSITASFATSTTSQTFAVPGYYLSYFGSLGISKMSASSVVVGSGAPTSSIATAASHLFPFTTLQGSTYTYVGNYQVWAGKCASEQPLSPPPGIDIATVTPGSAVAATVGEPAIDASITGNGAKPLDVKITYSDGTCTDVWSPVASAGTDPTNGYAVYPAPFVSNAAKGDPASNVPGVAGSLAFCVDYKSGSSTWHKQTVPITNTSFTAPTVLTPIDLAPLANSSSPC